MNDSGVEYRLGELAERFGCELRGDPAARVQGVCTLQDGKPGHIAFLANSKYRRHLAGTRAEAVILAAEDADASPTASLVAENPYLTYARLAALFDPTPAVEPGIHPSAVVEPGARIAEDASLGPQAVVGADSEIGSGVVVGPGCVIGRDVRVGAGGRLVARVTLCDRVSLGERVVIQPGAVIGGDGFGLAPDGERWVKVPQLGSVRIGNDVEIGANTTVDRGALEDTVIEDGVKLDNLIQIAHNVHIGEHTVAAALVGISGSTRVGRRCMLAGAVGVVGHVEIADDVVVTGQSVVSHSITEPGSYSSGGLGLEPTRQWRRNAVRMRQLDDMARRLTALEKKVGGHG